MMRPTATRWRPIVDRINRRPAISLTLFLLLLACLVLLGWARAGNEPVDVNMLSLVMPESAATAREKANARIQETAERNQTWVVTHPDREVARKTARLVESMLRISGLYEERATDLNPLSILSFYAPYRFRLASDDGLVAATQPTPDALVEDLIRSLYRSSTVAATSLDSDPFLLQAGFVTDIARTPPPFAVDNGLLGGRIDDSWVYVVPGRLSRGAFDLDAQRQVARLQAEVAVLEDAEGAQIRSLGAVDFAIANRALAVHEFRIIGGCSLLLVVGLLVLTFRHYRPFLAVGVILIVAVIAGFAACLIAFRSIHMITLIAGSSLIGISVDYAFHLLSDSYRTSASTERWTVSNGLVAVLPATLLGLTTSLLGLSGLFASGFSGLQQIAVFSAAGLLSAWLGLLLCSSVLIGSWQPAWRQPASLRFASWWARFYRPGPRVIFVVSAFCGAAFLILPAPSADNDIRLLTARTPEINKLVELSTTLSAHLLDNRFLLIQAEDDEALLQLEERIRPELHSLVETGAISHFSQISRFVPSLARQSATLAANRSLIESPGDAIEELQRRIALREETVTDLRQATAAAAAEPALDLDRFLSSPLNVLAENLYLGTIDGRETSITTFAGVSDPEQLRSAVSGVQGITLVDNVHNVSTAFGLYLDNARQGLVIAFVLVGSVMMWRFGFVNGAISMLVPLNAFILTLFCLAALGESINLFHVVGLTLVLGTGMDYTIFLKSGRKRPETMLAVLLAATTTECAFGLLGASQVGAIHSFGLTVALGTLATFLLAPMVANPEPGAHA